jgi:hypothetical protein
VIDFQSNDFAGIANPVECDDCGRIFNGDTALGDHQCVDLTDVPVDTCHEAVTRQGNFEPCERTAVALRIDYETNTAYPVCKHHARGGPMVPLATIAEHFREETITEYLREDPLA